MYPGHSTGGGDGGVQVLVGAPSARWRYSTRAVYHRDEATG